MTDTSGALLRDLRRPRHYNIDNEFIDDGYAAAMNKECTASVTVYNIICRCANVKTSRSFPSYDYIAEKGGITKKTAIKAIMILLKYRLLSSNKHIGRGNSNDYALLDRSEWVDLKKGVNATPIIKGVNNTSKILLKGVNGSTVKGVPNTPEQTNSFEQEVVVVVSSETPPSSDHILLEEREEFSREKSHEFASRKNSTAKPQLPQLFCKSLPEEKTEERRKILEQQRQQLLQERAV